MSAQMIKGIINVLKPPGMTSFDVVAYLRNLLNIKKIGHGGTLDPQAAGVLPICIGKATKAVDYIVGTKKVYRAQIIPGIITDTQDDTGEVIESNSCCYNKDVFLKTIKTFEGEIQQIPPMYSAIKVNGKKLYEYAREGRTIERDERTVMIYSITPVLYEENMILIDVECSKGTYIRTLCHDIGRALGCGACMGFLLRKAAGNFTLENSFTLEEIKDAVDESRIENVILPVETAFKGFPDFYLNDDEKFRYLNGNPFEVDKRQTGNYVDSYIKVFGKDNIFIGLGELLLKHDKIYLKPKKMF